MAGPSRAPGRPGADPHHGAIWSLLEKAGLIEHPSLPTMIADPYASAAMADARRNGAVGGRSVGAPSPPAPAGSRIMAAFGGAPPMSQSEEADLRRRQAIQAEAAHRADVQNSPYAIAALAPVATVLGLEGAGGVVGDLAHFVWPQKPLNFPWREPPPTGETIFTIIGKRAHAALKAAVDQKTGWDAEKTIAPGGVRIRPDALTPARNPIYPEKRFNIELKPNTPSGRRAAARAIRRYTELTGHRTRAIFYDPEDYK